MDRLRGLLRLEDVALVIWVAAVAPILGTRAPAVGTGEATTDPGLGLLAVAAGVGALAMLAFRPAGDDLWSAFERGRSSGFVASVRENAIAWASFVVLVAIALVLDDGLAHLGIRTGEGFYFLVIIGGTLLMFASRALPTIPVGARRLLVTPFVLLAGGFFDDTVGGLFGALDPGGLLGSAPDAAGVALVVGLAVLMSAPFYALLVFAPRILADREGSVAAWVVRYVVFLAGSLGGVDWLVTLGR